jgi:hypothetical protein
MHYSSVGLAALTPIALATGPGPIATGVDLALALAIPVHMAIGGRFVVEDYVPKSSQKSATFAVYLFAGITTMGLVQLALGPGITETAKELWRAPKKN